MFLEDLPVGWCRVYLAERQGFEIVVNEPAGCSRLDSCPSPSGHPRCHFFRR